MNQIVNRHFTTPTVKPWNRVNWGTFQAKITDHTGKVIFQQDNVEAPSDWSQQAVNIVASKYFRTPVQGMREYSVNQLISRVVCKITEWGVADGYLPHDGLSTTFHHELYHILVHQYAAFNSPVWFNLGVPGVRQQASACFINSVEDKMESILDLAKTESMLFKFGSGAGSNLSKIRANGEPLSPGGKASGPLSFMRGLDSFAGAVKSGGTTRRAAKMIILDVDHPDIAEFIKCKALEEEKAWALIDAGFDGGFNVPGGAYDSVQYQNANHSVRLSNAFMNAVKSNGYWQTSRRTDEGHGPRYSARSLFREIAEATYICGDPGVQFDDTINKWHTCPNSGRINASNPCSEYMFLDDTACNLASINLLKFLNADGVFDVDSFSHVCEVLTLAQEIIVGNADYPTDEIAVNSYKYRTLGLGYCNLGSLLMASGLPYDSSQGRDFAAAITALMTGVAYRKSAQLAAINGPFSGCSENREAILNVVSMHQGAIGNRDLGSHFSNYGYIWKSALTAYETAIKEATYVGGFRNAQVTVLAPTGTIAFMMDADTTGIEPDIALVKYKTLVGGGNIKIVNGTVGRALKKLEYLDIDIEKIVNWITDKDTVEGSPILSPAHLAVFDCAFKPANGDRSIHWQGHMAMMAAVQPFISGAISKTVNLPQNCSVEDIESAYMWAWESGIKAVAIYRDNSKRTQPLNVKAEITEDIIVTRFETVGTEKLLDDLDKISTALENISGDRPLFTEEEKQKIRNSIVSTNNPQRRKLPDDRQAITHKFSIAGQEGYLTVGLYEDETPGELFIRINKQGSMMSGLMDSIAIMISMSLQYGVPLEMIVNKFKHTRFDPHGYTTNKDIRNTSSLMDYICRWLEITFISPPEIAYDAAKATDEFTEAVLIGKRSVVTGEEVADKIRVFITDGPPCPDCGGGTTRSGSCYRCVNCGSTTGCS